MSTTMHAADWLDQHASDRRSIGLTFLRRQLDRAPGRCTWCGGECASKRYRWCSKDCREAAYLRCDVQTIRSFVWRRDRGVCANCGVDTDKIYKRLERIRERAVRVKRCYSYTRWQRLKRAYTGSSEMHFWEADHIVPVAEGGGCKGPENYRTLCIRCHKAETQALAKRLAAARRDAARQLFAALEANA